MLNALLTLVVTALVMLGVFFGMEAAGTDFSAAISTAVLVGATGIQTFKSELLVSKLEETRRRTFERKLDRSRDHVVSLVKDLVERKES